MNQHTRERALRAMTAALLSSELTPEEVEEIVRGLKTDQSLWEQLARLVEITVATLRTSSSEPKVARSKRISDAALRSEHLLTAAQDVPLSKAAAQSPLSKEDVLNRLQSYAQNPNWKPNPEWSKQKLWQEFVKVAPASSLQPALLALEAGPVASDPYVDLIMSRGNPASTTRATANNAPSLGSANVTNHKSGGGRSDNPASMASRNTDNMSTQKSGNVSSSRSGNPSRGKPSDAMAGTSTGMAIGKASNATRKGK
jgi:hypothetical protein